MISAAPKAAFSESERERTRARPIAAPRESLAGEDYYGIPFLKRPTWRWHISSYFFFGGISGASFALGALAQLGGGTRPGPAASGDKGRSAAAAPESREPGARAFEDSAARLLRRSAFSVSLVSLLPCPVLLIWDLGRPARFHHMLRVWKPLSPMNVGAWILSGFGALSTAAGLHAAGASGTLGPLGPLARRIPVRLIAYAGLPWALALTGYTGPLLAGTSVPVWNQTPLLGACFVAGSFASATEAIKLELTARKAAQPPLERALKTIGMAAKAAEDVLFLAHVLRSGRAGRALWRSRHGAQLAAGVALGWAAAASSGERRGEAAASARRRKAVTALLGLAGAFLIRWAIVHAGRSSADDATAARAATRPAPQAPGWRAV